MQQAHAEASLFKVDKLTIDYGGEAAVRAAPLVDFDLRLREGEITCILGPSGCGKTTLLKALGGFIVGAPSGGVVYRGQYLAAPTPEIVMIFQENNLFPWLNVAQNVGFGLRFAHHVPKVARRDTVAAMLKTVGLDQASRRYPHQLSGGMRQRTAIARALVVDPSVLLLDEPFSALDISLRRRMHVLLREIWAASHKTMVMVTHSVEEAIIVGDRVIVMGGNPGRVMIDRKTADTTLKDRYSGEFLALQREIETAIY